MRAIQLVKYGSAETAFQTNIVADPQLQNTEDILIKVHSFGINFADVMARNGLYRAAPALPATLGYEVVGIVEKVNNPLNNNLLGKRVLGLTRFGGYAEYAISSSNGVIEIQDQFIKRPSISVSYSILYSFLSLRKNISFKK
jgi:NADPH2:quinone reductase